MNYNVMEKMMGRVQKATTLFFLGIITVSASVTRAAAQDTSEVAKQAQNPIARLISVPLENDFNPRTGTSKDESYVLQFKPVVPISVSKEWNMITRTIVPIAQLPDLAPGVDGASGLGDISVSVFLSPAKAGRVIWGAGPIVSFPTATSNILGTKKVSLGPTVVVLKSHGHWLYGTLMNNLISVSGSSTRPKVNQFLAQPFVNYNLRRGWYLTSSPVVTANWKADENKWTVPLGGGLGKIVHLGKQPINVYGQLFGHAAHPELATNWSARLQVQFLFPKK